MLSSKPVVSVIVPVYNGAAFVADAIECVRAQDCPAVEIIVVDDGSTDGTREVVAGFGGLVRYSHQQNQGPASARNHGLRLARGSLVAFLDVDDLWPSGSLALLHDYMRRDSTAEIVLGRIQYVRRASEFAAYEAFRDPCLSLSVDAALFRREVFDKVGLFDAIRRSSEDIDWFLRAREAGVVLKVVDEIVLLYRRHGQNLTLDRDRSHRDFAFALKRSLDRRRRSGLAAPLGKLTG